ncbi:unnamed protein product [Closterium sp. Yama58-4]|nr:unnamed protein product [Closterium sp. Yama58-4]
MAGMSWTHELKKAMEMKIRALDMQLEKTRRELAAAKGELAAVKQELTEHKGTVTKQLDMVERRRETDLRELRAELARERRREVQQLNWPRAMEELAACKEWQRMHDLKSNIRLEIGQSEGNQKKALKAIKAALQETHLNLSNLHGVSDSILRLVSTITHLKSIDLCSTSGFTAEGIRHLYRLPQLEELELRCTDVTDSALEGVGSLVNLEILYLKLTKVTDAGLSHLRGLHSLKALGLGDCKGVTNAGMVHVGRLTGLEQLWLNGTAVRNDGLEQLTALTKLTYLCLPNGGYVRGDVHRQIAG